MKFKKLFIICFFVIIPLFNVHSEESSKKLKDIVIISVTGMVCTSCEVDIEQTFQAKKEVKSVDAIFDEKSIKLEFKDGMRLSNQEIKTIVEDIGYKVKSIN